MSDAVIWVIEQSPQCGPGRIADVFARRRANWELCRAGSGERLPGIERTRGLVLLGGPMSANDSLPFLQAELKLIERALREDIPVLGVCLGAQLLAKAMGARVTKNPVPEIGWMPICPTEEAAGDPVLGSIRRGDPVFQWHSETFDLPSGAVQLAYSERCSQQAFRYGQRVYGVQFHPEVDSAIIQEWLDSDRACASHEASNPIDPSANGIRANRIAAALFGGWLHTFSQG